MWSSTPKYAIDSTDTSGSALSGAGRTGLLWTDGTTSPFLFDDFTVTPLTAPVLMAAPQELAAFAGLSNAGVLAYFTDTNAGAAADDFTATIDWGDGGTSSGTVTADPRGGFDVSGSHTYAATGTYAVSVAIADGSGHAAAAKGRVIVVGPPSAGTVAAIDTSPGAFYLGALASFTGGLPDSLRGGLGALIQWGDGTTSAGTVARGGGGVIVQGSHTYAAEGTETFTVQLLWGTHVVATATGSVRVSAGDTTPVATTTDLYYSAAWQVIEERQGGTAAADVSHQYVWSPVYVDAMVLRDDYQGGTRTQRLYAQQDANFNTTALVDTGGMVVEWFVYSPYGAVTVLDAGGAPRAGDASAYGWQYLFQGSRLDTATGWYDDRNRDYIPSEGRFAQRDPLGLTADLNSYRYVGNSPTSENDPSGLEEEGWFGAAKALMHRLVPATAIVDEAIDSYKTGDVRRNTTLIHRLVPSTAVADQAIASYEATVTVWGNASERSTISRAYAAVGTGVGTFVGVRQFSDAWSDRDAVDGHVQTLAEQVSDGFDGSLSLVLTAIGIRSAAGAAKATLGSRRTAAVCEIPAASEAAPNAEAQSIYKAPQAGKGQKQLTEGYHADDFPATQGNDGKACFAKEKSIADEYAPHGPYGEGVIEVQVPKDVYDARLRQYEEPYHGGPRTQLPIPHKEFDVLNNSPRRLHP
jgi:RHS repeat-associated protein